MLGSAIRMSDRKLQRRDREVVIEFDSHLKDIRQNLGDQLKCLDTKLEAQVAIVVELQDFFRRRAELELDYSRNLAKLVKQAMDRDKTEKQRRENWPLFSTYKCWKSLLTITKKQSKDHQVFSNICNNDMVSRLNEITDNTTRVFKRENSVPIFLTLIHFIGCINNEMVSWLNEITDNTTRVFKRCRDIGSESHDNIMQVLTSLQSTMKTYHADQSESKQAEAKLKSVEQQKQKLEQQMTAKSGTLSNRKMKSIDRQVQKRLLKYSDNKFKALKARNDYLLNIDASNAALNKYYSDDISDLMDCMDFGYHNSIGRAMMMYLSVEEEVKTSSQMAVDLLNKCISDLDAGTDKQRFMEINNSLFMLPKKFEFQPYKSDEVRQISAQKCVQEQLVSEHGVITNRIGQLKLEIDETWKTLETTEKYLMDLINVQDYEVSSHFREEDGGTPVKTQDTGTKKKSDRQETENFYLQKFREYTLGCNRLARLSSKLTAIQKALGDNPQSPTTSSSRPPALPPKPSKRRIGRVPVVGQPKLFGGSLEEYIEMTGQEIPTVIKSSIRVIGRHGLHHQGIFRVSGSQVEINDFRNKFEKGDDPMMDIVDACDINSVAGVLKLYFRELREPLFPLHLFDELISCSKVEDTAERIEKIKDLIDTLHPSINIVMRYLFGFLKHLSESAEENMMDPYNLAICFGPTLLPIPPDRDQVVYQSSVNEVIKTVICHPDEIFVLAVGEKYDRAMTVQRDGDEQNNAEDDNSSLPSDEESEILEATALYDFEARTERELTFKKGDHILIYNRASNDWWEGITNEKEGLIPDKYISFKQSFDSEKKSQSSEEDKISAHSLSMRSMTSLKSSPDEPLPQPVEIEPCPLPEPELEPDTPPTTIRETDIVSVDSLSSCSPPLSPMSLSAESLDVRLENLVVEESPAPDDTDNIITLERQISSESAHDSELSVDIDNALAEVMSGLKSLEMHQHTDKRLSLPVVKTKQVPKHTPDLVLDLPEDGSDSPPSVENLEIQSADSPTMSAAETFAKSNQSTLKKASVPTRSMSVTIPPNTGGGDSLNNNSTSPMNVSVNITSPTNKNRFSLSEELRDDSPASVIKRSQSTTAAMRARTAQLLEQQLELGQQRKPPTFIHPLSLPQAEKPKARVKPAVLKKPVRSPEVPRKMTQSDTELPSSTAESMDSQF